MAISLKALKASVGHGDPCPFWGLSPFSIVEFRIISLRLRGKYGAFAGQRLVVTGHLLKPVNDQFHGIYVLRWRTGA